MANQVFEHLKQIYRPLDEIHRVTKPNGYLLFGVPNLASLHNRLLLSLGRHPTCIQMFTEHVRAFTPRSTIGYLTHNDLFELVSLRGVGFYPLLPPVSTLLARMFPNSSVIMLMLLKKNDRPGVPHWQDEIDRRVKQSNF